MRERALSLTVVIGSGIGVEFERMIKMECNNEHENDHFCKCKGRVQFF
jgi:hypothetical protein